MHAIPILQITLVSHISYAHGPADPSLDVRGTSGLCSIAFAPPVLLPIPLNALDPALRLGRLLPALLALRLPTLLALRLVLLVPLPGPLILGRREPGAEPPPKEIEPRREEG